MNRIVIGLGLSLALAGCQTAAVVAEGKAPAVQPTYSFPVTTNTTPYTRCLQTLASYPGSHLPSFAVGEVADKTGQAAKRAFGVRTVRDPAGLPAGRDAAQRAPRLPRPAVTRPHHS